MRRIPDDPGCGRFGPASLTYKSRTIAKTFFLVHEHCRPVVGQFDKEASQTRDYCGAKTAPRRAARPDPSLRKKRLLRMTIKLTHYLQALLAVTACMKVYYGCLSTA